MNPVTTISQILKVEEFLLSGMSVGQADKWIVLFHLGSWHPGDVTGIGSTALTNPEAMQIKSYYSILQGLSVYIMLNFAAPKVCERGQLT